MTKTEGIVDYTIKDFEYSDPSTVICTYDFGNHKQVPVYQHCERCYLVRGVSVPLCSSCGFRFNGMKVCNSCSEELENMREKEWLNG